MLEKHRIRASARGLLLGSPWQVTRAAAARHGLTSRGGRQATAMACYGCGHFEWLVCESSNNLTKDDEIRFINETWVLNPAATALCYHFLVKTKSSLE